MQHRNAPWLACLEVVGVGVCGADVLCYNLEVHAAGCHKLAQNGANL